jgi:hypothetical protein
MAAEIGILVIRVRADEQPGDPGLQRTFQLERGVVLLQGRAFLPVVDFNL